MLEPQMSEVERLGQVNLLAQQLAGGAIGLRDVVDRVCAKQPGTDRLMLVMTNRAICRCWSSYCTSCGKSAREARCTERRT
jgi:hypothetical protein